MASMKLAIDGVAEISSLKTFQIIIAQVSALLSILLFGMIGYMCVSKVCDTGLGSCAVTSSLYCVKNIHQGPCDNTKGS